ncbi:MAG: AsnC family protein [Nitrosopumilaceae archaeon]|jgi:DNA-binding Lrp family transcriptional regulator|nr:MAG: GAF sensor protein [Nitrosopumilales archaeon]
MIDELDRKILNLLISNGRQSSRTITKKLADEGIKISERGLGKRIARLEREKIIIGYTAIVDMKKVNMAIPRLVTVKLSSPKNYVQRLEDMKEYLKDAPFCDFSARSNGSFDWIELKFFNSIEQANMEADLYRTWFGDIIEDYQSYDLDVYKFGWQLFEEKDFHMFIQQMQKKIEAKPLELNKKKSNYFKYQLPA